MDTLSGADVAAWIARFADAVDDLHGELTDLDRRAGDGDFGHNVRAALTRARILIDSDPPAEAGAAFTAVSAAFLAAGGSSGPLLGMWFRELGKAPARETALTDLANATDRALRAVQRLGHAEPGDKTMVDAMAPAAAALADAAHSGADLISGLSAAARAARAGAESTAAMTARRGRASYLGERARGVVDPGALAIAVFFESSAAVTDRAHS